jgi:glycerol-3-phosphate dehydrogenase
MPNYTTEIAIVGGGICGLWLLNLLRDRGYDANLFEASQLGVGQTLASQGMIHGGIKYTLGGFTTPASETIANMPSVWRDCINGTGPINLEGLTVRSDDYFLFSDGALSSKVTAFFASKSLRGRVTPVAKQDYPEAFANPRFKGNLYKLQDLVIDTSALLKALHGRYANHIFHARVALGPRGKQDQNPVLELQDGTTVTANQVVLCAGEGNRDLITSMPDQPIRMQTRPLKQVLVKGALPEVYAHAVSLKDAAKPRLTITTHPMPDGDNVWYLGGNLAEQGVSQTDEALIQNAKLELKQLLPWINTEQLSYRTLPINRAEPSQDSGNRPDFPYVKAIGPVITCWPTKLTLTPMLGDEVLGLLPPPDNRQNSSIQLPLAELAPYPWETAFA